MVLMLAGLLPCWAQSYQLTNVTVTLQNGWQMESQIGRQGGIYFQGETLVVTNGLTGTSSDTEIGMVQKILFSDGPVVGIPSVEKQEFVVSPNPAAHLVTVSGLEGNCQEVVVYNVNGQKMMQQTMNDGDQMDVSKLPAGLYLMRSGNRFAKIVKQ